MEKILRLLILLWFMFSLSSAIAAVIDADDDDIAAASSIPSGKVLLLPLYATMVTKATAAAAAAAIVVVAVGIPTLKYIFHHLRFAAVTVICVVASSSYPELLVLGGVTHQGEPGVTPPAATAAAAMSPCVATAM
jgi:hypothetical protein